MPLRVQTCSFGVLVQLSVGSGGKWLAGVRASAMVLVLLVLLVQSKGGRGVGEGGVQSLFWLPGQLARARQARPKAMVCSSASQGLLGSYAAAACRPALVPAS